MQVLCFKGVVGLQLKERERGRERKTKFVVTYFNLELEQGFFIEGCVFHMKFEGYFDNDRFCFGAITDPRYTNTRHNKTLTHKH